ncbi:DUF2589 domain-containing protein [Pseudomonas typographi]|uniref:DUF2589 domain-containing protein n=1 Tax=Pseudomonas typographi TaxID=2715964 RepID=A0ABR7Z9I0_9PSED|nr:DUF2589 domain-containing protein [Pseudomonas typographi]MBD1589554.1 DUF2589 domain-containing protein [Pseudomonas typographi]MBD1602200.1 DUF2589 domain-containing protein [Pseudomonas typographi]
MIDKDLIGSVLHSLPMDRVFSAPLHAMIQAQVSANKAYADFLMGVCIQQGKAVAIEFTYDENIVDEQGIYQGQAEKRMRIPLVAAVTHPNIAIEEGTIDFELTIDHFAENTRSTAASSELSSELGWGAFNVSVKGSVSHAKEQTRKTDTRARYQVKTVVRRQAPPEALMRVIDALTSAASKPLMFANAALVNTDTLPEQGVLKLDTAPPAQGPLPAARSKAQPARA